MILAWRQQKPATLSLCVEWSKGKSKITPKLTKLTALERQMLKDIFFKPVFLPNMLPPKNWVQKLQRQCHVSLLTKVPAHIPKPMKQEAHSICTFVPLALQLMAEPSPIQKRSVRIKIKNKQKTSNFGCGSCYPYLMFFAT